MPDLPTIPIPQQLDATCHGNGFNTCADTITGRGFPFALDWLRKRAESLQASGNAQILSYWNGYRDCLDAYAAGM